MQYETLNIRPVSGADAAALVAVYAPYVMHTAITFEYDTPSAEEFRRRIADISSRFPYLVAENGEISEVDCCYGNCVYQGSCLIAKEIDGMKSQEFGV